VKQILKFQLGAVLTAVVLLLNGGLLAADTPPAPPPGGSTLDQRVAQRKAERGTALSDTDSKRLVGNCLSGQGKLRSIQNNEVSMLEKHTKVYGSVDAKLWIAIGQLKLANQDTFQLQKQHDAFVDKTTGFQTIAGNYKQALDDSLLINCQADPNGFKALVDTVRIYHDQLRAQSADSHDYVVNTVKPSLTTFIANLQPKAATQDGN
jgi:hypothetical protein